MHRQIRQLGLGAALAALVVTGLAPLAEAGCGCTKPAPAPAEIRPAATYSEMDVNIFHPEIAPGETYAVTFVSAVGGEGASVYATAALRRDIADGAFAPHLTVKLPILPLGPAEIRVADSSGLVLLVADDAQFTVAPDPIEIPATPSEHRFPDYQAAVSRDGVVLVSLDFSDVQHARVFRAQALGHPLRFSRDDMTFWNAQGFLMQRLDENIPGLFSLDVSSSVDSNVLHYSRHEFNTYLLQHDERKEHAVDTSDPSWHTDGTPHIDHDHQILQIAARLPDGTLPIPGSTPPFEMLIDTYSLFHHGLFAKDSVELDHGSQTDSFDSKTGSQLYGSHGDVLSNGSIEVKNASRIDGDATASTITLKNTAEVTGTVTQDEPATLFLGIDVPSGLEQLGALKLDHGEQRTLGRGSYQASEIDLNNGATLLVDNSQGPVTIYVGGRVKVDHGAQIVTTTWDPERFALYVDGPHNVDLANEGAFYGVIYAPESYMDLRNDSELHGSFVAAQIKLDNSSAVHYDVALRGVASGGGSEARSYDEPPPEEIATEIEIEIIKAKYRNDKGKVKIQALSSSGSLVPLLVTIEGFVENAPMTWNSKKGRWQYHTRTKKQVLDGALAIVSSGDGSFIEADIE